MPRPTPCCWKPSPSIRSIGGRGGWPGHSLCVRRADVPRSCARLCPSRSLCRSGIAVIETAKSDGRLGGKRFARPGTLAAHAESGHVCRCSTTRWAGCTSGRATTPCLRRVSSRRRLNRPTTVSPRGSKKSPSSRPPCGPIRGCSRALLLGQPLVRPPTPRRRRGHVGAKREARSALLRGLAKPWHRLLQQPASNPPKPERPTNSLSRRAHQRPAAVRAGSTLEAIGRAARKAAAGAREASRSGPATRRS